MNTNIYQTIIIVLVAIMITSCSSIDYKYKKITKYPPDNFKILAKISIITSEKSAFLTMNYSQEGHKKTINLSSALGLWNSNIVLDDNKLTIDNTPINSTINDYLISRYKFDIPILALIKFIFIKDNIKTTPKDMLYNNWQIKYISTQHWLNNTIAKKIILTNKNDVKITVLIKQVQIL